MRWVVQMSTELTRHMAHDTLTQGGFMTSTLGKTRPRSLRRGNGKRNGAGEAVAVETQTAPLAAQAAHLDRNPGAAPDPDWVHASRRNRSAGERRAATLATRRT